MTTERREFSITITEPNGLHLRPAAALSEFVRRLAMKGIATRFVSPNGSEITHGRTLAILELCVLHNQEIRVILTENPDTLSAVCSEGLYGERRTLPAEIDEAVNQYAQRDPPQRY